MDDSRSGTCCSVEPVATPPNWFLSSSSSCVDILEAVTGMPKLVLLLVAALAASSALSFAFCCKYCSVCKHIKPSSYTGPQKLTVFYHLSHHRHSRGWKASYSLLWQSIHNFTSSGPMFYYILLTAPRLQYHFPCLSQCLVYNSAWMGNTLLSGFILTHDTWHMQHSIREEQICTLHATTFMFPSLGSSCVIMIHCYCLDIKCLP